MIQTRGDSDHLYSFRINLNGLDFGTLSVPEKPKGDVLTPEWSIYGTIVAENRNDAIERARETLYEMTGADIGPSSERITILSWHYRDITEDERRYYASGYSG